MIDKATIKTDLISVLKDVFSEINLEQYHDFEGINIIEDWAISSISFIALMVKIEEKFDIMFSNDKLEMYHFKTVDNIVDMIHEEMMKKYHEE